MVCPERERLLEYCAETMRTYVRASIEWQDLVIQVNTRSLPACSVIRPTNTNGVAMGVVNFLTAMGLFIGQPAAESALAALPAEGIARTLTPSSTHMEIAQESPRALKEPVGFSPSSLISRSFAPMRAPVRRTDSSGVIPSPSEIIEVCV
jgi:hypothetical protein